LTPTVVERARLASRRWLGLVLTIGIGGPVFTIFADLLVALGLAAITALTFWSVATSDASTAALGFLITWLYGFPLVLLAFVVDAAIRAAAAHRRRPQAREM
jgi:hypothetical protein